MNKLIFFLSVIAFSCNTNYKNVEKLDKLNNSNWIYDGFEQAVEDSFFVSSN